MMSTRKRTYNDADVPAPTLWSELSVAANEAGYAAAVGKVFATVVPARMHGPALVMLARTSLGLSQDGFAARLGVHRGVIARMETGGSRITADRARLIEAHTGVPWQLLVTPT